MKYLTMVIVALFIGRCRAAPSVQDYVDRVLVNIDDKVDAIETNPDLFFRIYRFYQQQYPRESTTRVIDFDQGKRAQIFKNNLKTVLHHNFNPPQSTFKLKINEMSAWTDEESNALRAKIDVEPIDNISVVAKTDIAV